jgi:hypothetical protein
MRSRNICLILALIAESICLTANGQTLVEGFLSDVNGAPQPFANVIVLAAEDSSFTKGEVANLEGRFSFVDLAPGDYFCEISMVGFATLRTPVFQIGPKPGNINLGTLVLKQNLDLQEVEIVARKAMIEVRSDKIVFNVAATPSVSGSNGLELLSKSPGVLVDMDRNISLLGKGGVQVYINGRPSRLSGTDLSNLLESMNADNIEDIEIISNPGSKYEAEGNAGIININLKRNLANGFNGTLSAAFTQGVYLRNNQSLAINYGGEKIRASFGVNRTDNDSPDDFIDEKMQNGFTMFFDAKELQKLNGYNTSLGLDYQLSEKHSLQFNAFTVLNANDNRLNSTTDIVFPQTNEVGQILESQTLLDRSTVNYNMNLNYRWNIGKQSNLSADVSGGRFTTLGETLQPNTFFEPDGSTVVAVQNNAFDSDTYIDMWSAKFDYDYAWEKLSVAAGARYASVDTDNRFAFFGYENGEPVYDPLRSNNFTYLEEVMAVYATADAKIAKNTTLAAGLRMEHTQSRGVLTSEVQIANNDVSRDYTDFFPNVSISFNDEKAHAFSLGIGRRITRPNYQNLNPFVSPLSQLQAWQGNPFLNPSYSSNLQASHVYKRKLTTIFSYTNTTDFVSTIFEIVGENGTILIPRNMQNTKSYSVSLSYPLEVNKFWEFIAFADAGYQMFEGDLEGTLIDLDNRNWNFRMQNNFSLPGDVQFELTYNISSDWIWRGSVLVQGNQSLNFGIRKSFLDQRLELRITGSDILLTTNDYFYNGDYGGILVDGVRSFDTRRFGAGATWKFGNQKIKGVRKTKGAMDDELKRLQGTD